jgi:hypothetical protein
VSATLVNLSWAMITILRGDERDMGNAHGSFPGGRRAPERGTDGGRSVSRSRLRPRSGWALLVVAGAAGAGAGGATPLLAGTQQATGRARAAPALGQLTRRWSRPRANI